MSDASVLAVVTDREAGKVKRLRHTPRCMLAACDVRGRPHGPSIEAIGRIATDAAEIEAGTASLSRRYGWQWRLLGLGARLRGRDPAETRALVLVRPAATG